DPMARSRREFLAILASAAASSGFSRVAFAADDTLPAFSEVPAASSGISWRHVNGRSGEMYLPETTGAGCGFLDYDNDGWMDIYLVNSGACDFYTPPSPLRNALYHNKIGRASCRERVSISEGGRRVKKEER